MHSWPLAPWKRFKRLWHLLTPPTPARLMLAFKLRDAQAPPLSVFGLLFLDKEFQIALQHRSKCNRKFYKSPSICLYYGERACSFFHGLLDLADFPIGSNNLGITTIGMVFLGAMRSSVR
jgi:hypothetical protein